MSHLENVVGRCLTWPQPPGMEVTAGCSPDKDPVSFLHNERAFGFIRSGFSSCIFKFLVPSNPSHPLNELRIVSYLPHEGIGKLLLANHLIR